MYLIWFFVFFLSRGYQKDVFEVILLFWIFDKFLDIPEEIIKTLNIVFEWSQISHKLLDIYKD